MRSICLVVLLSTIKPPNKWRVAKLRIKNAFTSTFPLLMFIKGVTLVKAFNFTPFFEYHLSLTLFLWKLLFVSKINFYSIYFFDYKYIYSLISIFFIFRHGIYCLS